MAFIAKNWWYIIFSLYNSIGLLVGVMYQIFVSSTECRTLCTWHICHGVICLVYYIFMRYFYKAFQVESQNLENEYVTLNQQVDRLMDNIGYGSNQCKEGEDSSQQLLDDKRDSTPIKIYSHELGALTFLCVYMASLMVGLVLYSQSPCSKAWLSYGTLALILGCVLSLVLHGCLRCNGIYTN